MARAVRRVGAILDQIGLRSQSLWGLQYAQHYHVKDVVPAPTFGEQTADIPDISIYTDGTELCDLVPFGKTRSGSGPSNIGYHRRVWKIIPGTYVLELSHGHGRLTYLRKIIVWPNVDAHELGKKIVRVLLGGDLDWALARALFNFDSAKRYISERFHITPHPRRIDMALVNGQEFLLRPPPDVKRVPEDLDRILKRYGSVMIWEYLDDQQLDFIERDGDGPEYYFCPSDEAP